MFDLYDDIYMHFDDDVQLTRINSNQVVAVLEVERNCRDDYRVKFRRTGETEQLGDVTKALYQIDIQQRDETAQQKETFGLLKKSKFANALRVDESATFGSYYLAEFSVDDRYEISADADFVDGKIVIMLSAHIKPNRVEETCSALSNMVNEILGEADQRDAKQEAETIEKYWLDGKEVTKDQFERKAGKDFWKNFDSSFKLLDFDSAFKDFDTGFKSASDNLFKMIGKL